MRTLAALCFHHAFKAGASHYGVADLQVAEVNPLRRASLEQHARCTAFDPRSTAVADSARAMRRVAFNAATRV